jgi:hypothetical protein
MTLGAQVTADRIARRAFPAFLLIRAGADDEAKAGATLTG